MKRLPVVVLVLASCATKPPAPAIVPADTRLADLQASMTELLERLDVMNDRITRLERAGEERAQSGLLPAGEGSALAAAQIADKYRNAITLYGKNRYPEARAAFQQVFDADASGDLADNALFWIGETYYAANDFNNAIRFYKRVADEYGDQNKAPDAMYKLALAYEKTSDLALARTTLQQVIARYPYSAPAASAKAELNRIKY
ncbi:MAG TPA: tetratricopeptide repeat protein [Thermoanaerobaculia bacterium]|nr:tetratricopeptide repeat protein [Thermoanaerobaculia bacterium]